MKLLGSIVCVAFLVVACAVAGDTPAQLAGEEAVSKSGEESAPRAGLLEGGRLWSRYRKLHDKIKEAKSLRSLESLADKVDDLDVDLEEQLPGDAIADDLVLILTEALETQEEILDRPRGRQPATDYAGRLRRANPRTAAYRRVAERLLDQGTRDAWVTRNIYAALVSSISGTGWLADGVRRDLAEGRLAEKDQIRELLAESDLVLSEARELAKRLPPEAHPPAED